MVLGPDLTRIGKLGPAYADSCPFCAMDEPETLPCLLFHCMVWQALCPKHVSQYYAELDRLELVSHVEGFNDGEAGRYKVMQLFGGLSCRPWAAEVNH